MSPLDGESNKDKEAAKLMKTTALTKEDISTAVMTKMDMTWRLVTAVSEQRNGHEFWELLHGSRGGPHAAMFTEHAGCGIQWRPVKQPPITYTSLTTP